MELASRRIIAPAGGRAVKLYPLGDIHLGAAACDLEHFRRTVEAIRSDDAAYWLGMGDYGDLIMPSDPRWSFSGHDWRRLGYTGGRPSVSNLGVEHRDFVRRELEPIAGKCLGLHFGNHEQAFARHYFVDVTRYLCQEWSVPFLGYTAITRLEVEVHLSSTGRRVWRLDIFSEHGANGGGTDGNALNALQRRGNEFDADVFLKGHVHKYGVSHKVELGYGRRDTLRKRDRLFMLTGTYLKGYTEYETTYGEYKAYPPNEIGGGVVILEPAGERIHGTSVEALAAVA